MLSEQRYKEVLNLLEKKDTVKSSDLCRIFGISRETVRRDLEAMEAKGMLRRIHGGAMRVEQSHNPEFFHEGESLPSQEAIARKAMEYIKDGQSIALDSGAASLALAKEIKDKFRSLTVVTNSLAMANELSDCEGITLVMTGGVYHAEEEAFVSDMATLIFSKINIDTFFLTTCGISVERGVTYRGMDEIHVQNAMLEASEQVIVIADSSKLGENSFVKMCGIEEVSVLITDSDAPMEQVEAFGNAGVNVVMANADC